MQGMSLVDILVWGVLLIFMAKGFLRGLVREVCSVLGLVAGGWAAFKYATFLAEAARPIINLPSHIATALSFVLIFLLIGMFFYLVGHLLTVVFKIMLLGGVNRVGGVVFGGLEGALILCMVLYLCTTRPVPERFKGYLLRSPTGHAFAMAGREIVAGWESSRPARRAATSGK